MIPLSIELKNFLSHRNSFVDFSQFQSALIIGNIDGNYDYSNGSGKSSLLSSIMWCLFNKSKAAAADDVIMWGESNCEVTFIFSHFNQVYKVIRRRSRVNSTTSVDFYRLDPENDGWINISGSTSSLTNQEIEKVIKLDHKTFINSIYFAQNDISEFADADPAKKKSILKSIIDLSKWDSYEENTKEKLRILKQELKILESKLDGTDRLQTDLDEITFQLKLSKDDLVLKQRQKQIISESLESTIKEYDQLKQNLDTNLWDQTVEKIDKCNKQLSITNEQLNILLVKTNKYKESISLKEKKINDISRQYEGITFTSNIEEKIEESSNSLINYKSKFDTATNLISQLSKKIILEDLCYSCHQKISPELYLKLKNELENELSSLNSDRIYAENKIKESEHKLSEFKILKEANSRRESLKIKLDQFDLELKVEKERLEESLEKLALINNKKSKLEEEINSSKLLLESITNSDFKKLRTLILDKKENLKIISKQIDELNHQVGVLSERWNVINGKLINASDLIKDLNAQQSKIMLLEKLYKLLGKNGIQTILLNAVIADLEKSSNEILHSICNEEFIIYLDTQRTGTDGSIVDTLDLRIKKDGVIQNYKSLSGGEQFRISLALRIGLSEVSSRHGGTSLEFLLLDEINSPLDRHGTESLFVNVIAALEKKYKILVITHNDFLKEKFGSIIEITKINGESSINLRLE